MKPRFEEHEGQLFRMLEKPVPLTPDAEMPCLVRLIQDDSPMGRYNRDVAYFDVIGKLFVVQKIKENPFYSNTLHAYEKNSLNQDYCIASIHTLEIIGYPVAEGSAEWAWYQMMQGETVTFLDYPNRTLKLVNGYIQDSISDGFWNRKSGNEFLSYASSTGWQIYKEPKPKPLLADAKVGDLCKTDLDEWIQIDDTSEPPSPILYHYDRLFKGNIIHTEPLAPEGSAEWAWQMLMLGKTVYNPAYYYRSSHGLITPDMFGNCSKQSFVNWQEPTGWQLYEPEPEPEPKERPLRNLILIGVLIAVLRYGFAMRDRKHLAEEMINTITK